MGLSQCGGTPKVAGFLLVSPITKYRPQSKISLWARADVLTSSLLSLVPNGGPKHLAPIVPLVKVISKNGSVSSVVWRKLQHARGVQTQLHSEESRRLGGNSSNSFGETFAVAMRNWKTKLWVSLARLGILPKVWSIGNSSLCPFSQQPADISWGSPK